MSFGLQRVLIIKFWALGDIVMATPILTALRSRYPEVEITWAIDSKNRDLLDAHPDITDVISIDTRRWRCLLRNANIIAWSAYSNQLRKSLTAKRFDAVINCHPEIWWTAALCPRNAIERIALYPSSRTNPVRYYYTKVVARAPMHETLHYLRGAEALGCPAASLALTLGTPASEVSFIHDFEKRHKMCADDRIVVLAPFASSTTKCWAIERFAEFATALAKVVPGIRFVVTHGPGESDVARCLTRAIDSPLPAVAAHETSLSQYVALIRRATIVVCSDSSPVHIAAATGTPYVALFGMSDPTKLAPLRGCGVVIRKALGCSPCWQKECSNPMPLECMEQITVAEVLKAVAQLLSGRQELPVAPNSFIRPGAH